MALRKSKPIPASRKRNPSRRQSTSLSGARTDKTTTKSRTTSQPNPHSVLPEKDFHDGDRIVFRPEFGTPRQGVVKFDFEHREGYVLVQLRGDPYSVYVSENQIEKVNPTMPTTETTKKPRTQKRTKRGSRATQPKTESLGELLPGSEKPVRARKATGTKRPAKKAPAARKAAPVAKKTTTARKTTKAPAKKAAPVRKTAVSSKPGPKVSDRANDNPFRPDSNSWHYTEAIKKGGKRSALVRALLKKIDVHPWSADETYADVHMEVDKRLTMVVKALEKTYGWVIERRGRGPESFVKGNPPSGRATKAVAKTTKARTTRRTSSAAA